MIRSGGIRPITPTAASTSSTTARTTPAATGVGSEARFASGIDFAARARRVGRTASPAPMACSGSRTSTGRAVMPVGASRSPPSSSRPRTWSGRSRPTPTTRWPSRARRTAGGHAQPRGPRPEHRARTATGQPTYQPTNDWRFSWMITAQQNNASNGASFDGNIVVFENRPFAHRPDHGRPGPAGETVVEGVFGYSKQRRHRPRATPRLRRRRRPDRAAPLVRRPSPTPSSRSATGSPT